jgi:ABC-type multidrug transport system ATPase subunit
VIRTLRELAKTGRTIVSTIHQPSSDVFHMFDDLLLLAEGRVIYQGEGSGAIPYFSKLDFKCPNFVNPADFLFMAVLNNEEEDHSKVSHSQSVPESEGPREDSKERINRLLLNWTSSDEGLHDAQSNISRHANI